MVAVFELSSLDDSGKFAHAYVEGTYIEHPDCPKCGAFQEERISPLVIEWEPGSDLIADFTFLMILEVVLIKDPVREFLKMKGFTGFEFGPVTMIQNPKLKKPLRPNRRSTRRVWLPYEGPPLSELKIAPSCDLNYEKSRWTLLAECDTCHTKQFSDDKGRGLPYEESLIVDGSTWNGSDFFRLHGNPITYVTERAAEALQSANFSNLRIRRRGFICSANIQKRRRVS